jgi:hypothetical protein
MMLRSWRAGWLAALLLGGLAILLTGCPPLPPPKPVTTSDEEVARAGPGSYLFCFWNVENLFDDQDDDRHTRGDHEPDAWFSHDKKALATKLDHLCKVLLPLNGGRGPDILAVAELESARSAELLQQALNQRLSNPELYYKNILFEDVAGGRHIATALITRLPVEGNRTHLLGRRLRILECRVKAAGKPLVVIASHWSSRVGGQAKTEPGRDKYADVIYGRFKEMYLANSRIDLLVCGDFNDNPTDPSVVDHLHATGEAVRPVHGAVPEGRGEPCLRLQAEPEEVSVRSDMRLAGPARQRRLVGRCVVGHGGQADGRRVRPADPLRHGAR